MLTHRFNVNSTSICCVNVEPTLFQRRVPAGTLLVFGRAHRCTSSVFVCSVYWAIVQPASLFRHCDEKFITLSVSSFAIALSEVVFLKQLPIVVCYGDQTLFFIH